MRHLLLLLLLLLGADVSAQEYRYNVKFTLSDRDFADTIAIEVEHGAVYVPVTIGGQSYRFLLDTGASMGAVYTDVSIDGMTSCGRITSHDANGRSHATEVVTLPPLQLGSLVVSGYHANLVNHPPGAKKADGIIGFDIFNKGLLGKIDIRQRHLILTDRKKFFADETGYEARYRMNFHVPYVTLCPFGRYQEPVRFDTGARTLYTISRQSFEAGAQQEPVAANGLVTGRTWGRLRISHFGAEPLTEITALCLADLKWAGYSFRRVRTLTSAGPSTIGCQLLNHGSVIINPKRRLLIFQPYGEEAYCTIDNQLPDIYYVPVNGRPSVGLVWEQSKPYECGFRQGDVILQINDTPITSFQQFLAYPMVKGMAYTFTVRDKENRTRQVRFTK